MKSTYPQIISPEHLNGHATEYQLQQMIVRVSRLEEDNARLKRRGNDWRDMCIGALALAVFQLGVEVMWWLA